MRITLSAAMRARDVSRPSDEQLAAAATREEAADRAVGAGRPAVSRPGATARADVAEPIAAAADASGAPVASVAPGTPVASVTPGATARPAGDGQTPTRTPAPPRRRRRRRG